MTSPAPAPAGSYDPLVVQGSANDSGPARVDPDADYTPALTPNSDATILHQRDVEKVIDARVAVLKAAGLLAP
jgi:hypothetical protein